MQFPQPYDRYRWLSTEDGKKALNEVAEGKRDLMGENKTSFFFEVDLEYPERLAKRDNSMPLAPHVKDIVFSDLSPFSQNVLQTLKGSSAKNHKVRKLTSTMHTRKNYLVHALNLQYYLQRGLKVTKLHRVIAFRQRSFLKPFIQKCTDMRRSAKTKAAANIWKLAVNS